MRATSSSIDRRALLRGGLVALGAAGLAGLPSPAHAAQSQDDGWALPRRIALPDGFSPEDVAAGRGSTFYVGSLSTGGVFRGDFRTGRGRLLVAAASGPTTGLFLERRDDDSHDRLWAAGGPSGVARVYDAATGRLLRTYHLAAADSGAFVSDIVVTRTAAYVTNAFQPRLYVLPLGHEGALPGPGRVRRLPVTGDVRYQSGSNVFNLNGLVEVDGQLVTDQTVTGQLFTLSPTGRTRRIELVDASGRPAVVDGADGMVVRDHTLTIARNFPERIAVVRLDRGLRRAHLLRNLADPRLDIPSSVEVFDGHPYALNARFTTPATPTTTYDVVRL